MVVVVVVVVVVVAVVVVVVPYAAFGKMATVIDTYDTIIT